MFYAIYFFNAKKIGNRVRDFVFYGYIYKITNLRKSSDEPYRTGYNNK